MTSGLVDITDLLRYEGTALRQEIGGIPLGSCDGGLLRQRLTHIYIYWNTYLRSRIYGECVGGSKLRAEISSRLLRIAS